MSRSRYTNPVENMRSYIYVHNGLDKDERLADVEWIEAVVDAARDLTNVFPLEGDDLEVAIDKLRSALRA